MLLQDVCLIMIQPKNHGFNKFLSKLKIEPHLPRNLKYTDYFYEVVNT